MLAKYPMYVSDGGVGLEKTIAPGVKFVQIEAAPGIDPAIGDPFCIHVELEKLSV
jgi:hypothetical protein